MSEADLVGVRTRSMRSRSKESTTVPSRQRGKQDKSSAMDVVEEGEDEKSLSTPLSQNGQKSSQRSATTNGHYTNGNSPLPQNGTQSRPTSPNSLSLSQEKDELKNLNCRLEDVLRVRQQTLAENAKMKAQIEQLMLERNITDDAALEVCKQEVDTLRKALDHQASQHADAQMEVDKLSNDLNKARAQLANERRQNADLDSQLKTTDKNLRDLQSALRDAEATKDEAVRNAAKLERELKETEDQLKDLRDTLDQEVKTRIKLQNEMNTTVERAKFETKLAEEKTRRCTLPAVDAVDSTSKPESLIDRESFAQIQDEFTERLEEERVIMEERLEEMYSARVRELQLQVRLLEDEIQTYRRMAETSTDSERDAKLQSRKLMNERDALMEDYRKLQDMFDEHKQKADARSRQITDTMMETNRKYQDVMEEYRELQRDFGALTEQIRVYDHLLQTEEKRLSLTSSNRKRTAEPLENGSERRVRQRISRRPANSNTKFILNKRTNKSSATGPLRLLEVEPGKVVRLENTSDGVIMLKGYRIAQASAAGSVVYNFDDAACVNGKGVISIFSAGCDMADDNTERLWDKQWLSANDLRTTLFDEHGKEIAMHETEIAGSLPATPLSAAPERSRSGYFLGFIPNPFSSAEKEYNGLPLSSP